ncbi:hypothetical protein SDC9_20905 [bioreactor metagenome]|uniref:DUF3795 domain-containing protein n=1 Tax=bioreactor metagenome TaxID=1076179 RepID=A0A644U811_9ZZZZ|nr:DUF3795 domain-containing protein [Negativicutes bacterium]
MLSVCGVICGDCKSYGTECAGCQQIEGKVFWAQYIGADICPTYKCVRDKSVNHCGECTQMPCELWFSLKDPGWSEEEHQASIKMRQEALTRSKKIM